MGDQSGNNPLGDGGTGAVRGFSRASFWKSAIVIAPLAGAALFIATGTNAQTGGSAPPPNAPVESTTVAPNPAPAAARRRGPKERDKVLTNRVASPTATDPANPAQTTSPVEAQDAQRKGGPKGDGDSGLTESPTSPEAQRKGGPKGDVDHGRTDAQPAPDIQPAGRGTKPKGAKGHGRTEAQPTPDTQPAARGTKPKPAGGSGRTSAAPLALGGLAVILAGIVVASGGNDRPASP